MTLFELVKIIFLTAILLYLAPFFSENLKKHYLPFIEPHTQIAAVIIKDHLYDSSDLSKQLEHFFKKPSIKGIIVKIDCADAAIATGQTVFHIIRQLKQEHPKPIITLVENFCLSGAYLIASACDYIVAPESALIGNIGPKSNDTLFNRLSSLNELNKESIENDMYQHITKQVAMGRKLSLTTTTNWANGKIFTATQAQAIGLINEIGSLYTIIKTIKDKALIENEIEWIERKELSIPTAWK